MRGEFIVITATLGAKAVLNDLVNLLHRTSPSLLKL